MDYKSGAFLAYQLLDALYRADMADAANRARALYEQYADNGTLNGMLSKLVKRGYDGEEISMREYNGLRAPLVALLTDWLEHVTVRLSYLDGKNFRVVLSDRQGGTMNESDKIEPAFTVKQVLERTRFCFPADGFDYDRMYLSGKLNSLSSSRTDVSIALSGSSYAMVGLKEAGMPRPAVNLAVNAQDPYYAFKAVETAVGVCDKIDTAVIAGGYYFWHTDMSDNPSDYYKSVLTRTNYPIFKDSHNYKGEIPSPVRRAQTDPLLEKLFDFESFLGIMNDAFSKGLEKLAYFNKEFNPRPANGMLQFAFREQSDEVNDKAAQARAQAHNGNFNPAHLEDNMRLFQEFLARMAKKNVKIILITPPATHFYRAHSAPELRETVRLALEPLKREFGFRYLDLFDSPDFSVTDFQDYDHLNDAGADKLSGIVAGLV